MNLVFATATQLAQMIRDKEVSAVEVLDAYLKQIDRHNEKINAIATLNREKAKQRAIEADEALVRGENWGALHGVPITLKDTFETAGLLTTAGYKPLNNYIPSQDATVVARLRRSGAIILGKTNLAEMASDFQSTNELFGRVNNPWDLNYTPGGSSGGSAAAIAAGFSALELGNDASGSEIKETINLAINKLKPLCLNMKQWASPPFDLHEAFRVCNQLTALNFVYSQPVDFDDAKKTLPVMFREATQGDKELRDLSNLSQFLPALLNPALKGYFEILTQRDRFIAQMDKALEPWDVWLCPVAMTTAFTHRPQGAVIEIEGRKVPYFLANGGYTMLFNLTGNPVVVIPLGQTETGLPIGMQIVGKRWQEMELLAIARQIDLIAGSFQIPPGY